MRLIRAVVVSTLVASVASIVGAAQPAAAAGAHTVFSINGTRAYSDLAHDAVYDPANSALTVQPADDASSISFTEADKDQSTQSGDASITITTTGGPLTTGSYSLADNPATISIDLRMGWTSCTQAPATVKVLQADLSDGHLIAFAAHYAVSCGGSASVSGDLRWQSSVAVSAVASNPIDWSFGSQPVGVKGAPKTMSFQNRGTTAITFGAASVSGPAGTFLISSNGCSGKTIAAGHACSLVVTPKPKSVVSDAHPETDGTLLLPAAGLPKRFVTMRTYGRNYYPIYAQPGPQHIDFSWDALPGNYSTSYNRYTVLRGTSAGHLVTYKHAGDGVFKIRDSAVTAGKTYYYAVFGTSTTGQRGAATKPVAAIAWPKYSAGMYHRVAQKRLLSSHTVTAGHPYTLRIGGADSVPTSGVGAVALSVLGAGSTAASSVIVYAAGSHRPSVANLSLKRGDTLANSVLTKVGRGGRVTIATTHGSVRVSVDISGYFSAKGLATKYGMGSQFHQNLQPYTTLNTAKSRYGPLRGGYYAQAPVIFNSVVLPHVTSFVVQLTASGAKGSGTLTSWDGTTNRRIPRVSALAYRRGLTISTLAIVPAAVLYADDGSQLKSIAVLNNGARAVDVSVEMLGYFDDNQVPFGQRLIPTAPTRLSSAGVIGSGGTAVVDPHSHARYWTAGLALNVTAVNPSKTTALSLWAHGLHGVTRPPLAQVRAAAGRTTSTPTFAAVGVANRINLRNATGRTHDTVYSVGRFDVYPVARQPRFATPAVRAARQQRPPDQVTDTGEPTSAGLEPLVTISRSAPRSI